jgi:hypothetical protein
MRSTSAPNNKKAYRNKIELIIRINNKTLIILNKLKEKSYMYMIYALIHERLIT